MNKAEQLIARLEGEIAKRDARIEAQEAQINILQSDANSWQSGYDEGRRMGAKHAAPVSEAKAQGVVMPEREECDEERKHPNSWTDHAIGWNACLDAVARLNAAPAAPAADAGLVEALELAANRLDRLALEQGEFWRGYATAWADEARATANGVKS